MQLSTEDPGGPLAATVRDFFAPGQGDCLGAAVSGGGDSTALLLLLADWAKDGGPALATVTVDHGLRPEAADEARAVGRLAARLGVSHEVLRWEDRAGTGNRTDRARRARYGLIAAWAARRGIGTVALGHTMNDQAETVLMRLARGSGVDGLSGMAARRVVEGVAFVRPLLGVSRAALRDFLMARGEGWSEDPTNEDEAFDRVKARRALAALSALGLTAEGLVATAGWMARAREVLDDTVRDLVARAGRIEAGDLVVGLPALSSARAETRLRLVAEGLRWVTGAPYRPREEALRRALGVLGEGRRTLHGAVMTVAQGELRITREAAAVAGLSAVPGALWDGRWRVEGPFEPGDRIGAVGEAGLADCPGWRKAGLPRLSLLATPGVWRGGGLIAAPVAGMGEGWRAWIAPERAWLPGPRDG
ncbi:MAG: tRNA lysidine(34) synthetase TilS [Paracoccaceae bacterium]